MRRTDLRRRGEAGAVDQVQLACARLAVRCSRTWAPARTFERGDVLLDLSRAVERIVDVARTIVPDAVDDEERVALRVG